MSSYYPNWEDMPKPKGIAFLYWRDIYSMAEPLTQKIFNRDPTNTEIKELFKMVSHQDMDASNCKYWVTIGRCCNQYYGEIKE